MGPQMFFLAISNNLPIFTDELARARKEYDELQKSGKVARLERHTFGFSGQLVQVGVKVQFPVPEIIDGEFVSFIVDVYKRQVLADRTLHAEAGERW